MSLSGCIVEGAVQKRLKKAQKIIFDVDIMLVLKMNGRPDFSKPDK